MAYSPHATMDLLNAIRKQQRDVMKRQYDDDNNYQHNQIVCNDQQLLQVKSQTPGIVSVTSSISS